MYETQMPLEQQNIKSCAFTGHREIGADFSKEKLRATVEELVERGVEIFYCGMAQGFDLFCAEEIVRVKEKNENIKFIACVPYYGQEKKYGEENKKRYVELLKKSDEKIILTKSYFKGCELARNRYMAEQADVLVAYLRKKTGGTAYTVGYFQKKRVGKEILFL